MSKRSIFEARFHIPNPRCLTWAHWEVDSTLYNDSTGETHLLSPIPTEVVTLLQVRAMSFGDICTTMAARCGEEDSDPWRRKLASVIENLVALDIVEPLIDGS